MSEVISNGTIAEGTAGFGAMLLTGVGMRLDLLPNTTGTLVAGLTAGTLLVGHTLWRASRETQST